MVSAFLKTIFVPPLIALAIYLIFLYAFLPIYRRRQRYAQYLPVSLSPAATDDGFISRTRNRVREYLSPFVQAQWFQNRRRRTQSFDSYFGDEELEEGFEAPGITNLDARRDSGEDDGRRLSRELEAGFRDDSDDENGAENEDRRIRRDRQPS